MRNDFKILIPARGGSKRIKNKNIISLAGRPLISYVIETSLKITKEVYVSTDSIAIEKISKNHGAKIVKRPAELATDASTTNSTIRHLLNTIDNVSYFACVQPTSPLLSANYLQRGINKIKTEGYDTVISVAEAVGFYWTAKGDPINFTPKPRPREQDLEPYYVENGAFYITTKDGFLSENNLVNGRVGLVVMPKADSIDIDDQVDLGIADYTIRLKKS
jgi:CMP-N,N'-diacetyllegionaminic acid synthase|tara:strand:- start:609 stop:1265 length:657 start_codon:yes stop_codon:yes gene_type:complete